MFTSVLPELPRATPRTVIVAGPSKRVTCIPEDESDQSKPSAVGTTTLSATIARRKSSKGITASAMQSRPTRQFSMRKSLVLPSSIKTDVPPHLLKFLQQTPEQQQRLNAVKAILADEPSARNEMSLDVVYDWMLQNCMQYSNNIFGSAPEYIRREICRQMRLIKVLSQGVLIRQGDTGDRCYIVINGIVDIYVKKESELAMSEHAAAIDTKPGGRMFRGSTSSESTPPSVKDFGAMVANLGPGAMFGEVVLLNPTAKRNATIVASQYTESCELICLERADYIRLVRTASMEASHYNHAEILDQMYLFEGWGKHEKMRLVSNMRSMKFISNEYLYRAGSDAKWLFVITAGEVVERLNWAASSANDPMRVLLAHSKKEPETKVNIELALIGAGDIAGELPFVKAKWLASFDIKAVTDVQTLAIDRRYYESTMLSATPESNRAVYATLQKLKTMSREREDWRQQRLACGSAYPNAHISITWQLMRMSNLRCPRCGGKGHLATDTTRCSNPPPSGQSSARTNAHSKQHRKPRATLLAKLSITTLHSTRQRDCAVRELFDDAYLPTAKEQLASCRSQQQLASPSRTRLLLAHARRLNDDTTNEDDDDRTARA